MASRPLRAAGRGLADGKMSKQGYVSARLYFALFKPLGFWVGSHLCENADWVLKSENRKRSLLGALDWQEAG